LQRGGDYGEIWPDLVNAGGNKSCSAGLGCAWKVEGSPVAKGSRARQRETVGKNNFSAPAAPFPLRSPSFGSSSCRGTKKHKAEMGGSG